MTRRWWQHLATSCCRTCRDWRAGIDRHERNGNHWHAELARTRYYAHRRRAHGYRTPQLTEVRS